MRFAFCETYHSGGVLARAHDPVLALMHETDEITHVRVWVAGGRGGGDTSGKLCWAVEAVVKHSPSHHDVLMII